MHVRPPRPPCIYIFIYYIYILKGGCVLCPRIMRASVCVFRARLQRRAAALCVHYARAMCAPCPFALSLRALCIYAAQARPPSIAHKSRSVSAPCAFPARFVRSAGLSPSGCVIVPPYTRKARKRAKNGRCGAFVVFCGRGCGCHACPARFLYLAAMVSSCANAAQSSRLRFCHLLRSMQSRSASASAS